MKRNSCTPTHACTASKLSGMTLVELLVTLTIATLLFGGLVFVFRAVGLSEQVCEEQLVLIRAGRVALERISRDLRSCYPMRVQIPEELAGISAMSLTRESSTAQISSSGILRSPSGSTGITTPNTILTFLTEDNYNERLQLDQDSLRLTAAANDPRSHEQPSYDIVEVAYYIDIDPGTSEEGLVRAVGLLPGLVSERATGEEQKRTVLSPNIWALNFRYFNDTDSQWLDEWHDFEKLPAAVEVTIGVFPTRAIEQLRSQRVDQKLVSPLILTTVLPITIRHVPTALSLEQLQQGQRMQGAQEGQQLGGEQIAEPDEENTR
ncbi:MAG: type II secretion system protein GspJ [Armatimonadota bacterium]|nr:hypothetical protein [Armatimonadota bacterium]MCX7776884.1 hypothetical protein [Armatimonadota bacterium]MDW8024430.1 type II secretion system protein GspJ [Armatimonadota bacterium]